MGYWCKRIQRSAQAGERRFLERAIDLHGLPEKITIDKKIRFRDTVTAAAWSSQQGRWTVDITRGESGEPVQISCNFLYMCAGYYRYDQGYANASWTLKADLTSQYLCRLLNHRQRKGFSYCVPRNHDRSIRQEPWVDFSSGYFQRASHLLPKQGSKLPWKLHQNYIRDIQLLRHGKLDDGVLTFARAG